ncbi:hypothetical protein CMI39_00885 [Candidatus Pacearchaeota archaeon]|jgi:aryl-alcohol dehydrogenase-like predicted oxidoreductase|nr:hypothetical protein [Candidatus Pacearchaeota archaeon]|tara:strand:+ start:17065 stop:17994 length:930 start_codon:yes stop_codon:yes gene_type:complete
MDYNIPKRKLGKTGLDVTIIGLGGAGFAPNKTVNFFERPMDDCLAIETIQTAVEKGINLIDTSPFYGDSERRIGLFFKDYKNRDSIVLSTKAGTGPGYLGYSKDNFRRSVENSLKKLNIDYIDILHIHDPDEVGFEQALGKKGAIKEMIKMRKEGIVKYFGLGVRSHKLHKRFIESGFADVIITYLDHNLLRQSAKDLLVSCEEKNVGVMIGSALCFGRLSGKNPKIMDKHLLNIDKEIDFNKLYKMYDWCIENGLNLQQVNFNYILNNSSSVILIGSASPQEVKENIAATKPFSKDDKYMEFINHFNL